MISGARCLAVGAASLVAVLSAAPAAARDYYYFHNAHVSRDTYVADRTECDRLAGGVTRKGAGVPSMPYMPPNPNLTVGQNALAAGLAGLFTGLMSGSQIRKTVNAVERTCMADKGYARYRVDKAVVKEIEKLDSIEERVERYFALATSVQPVGERMKE